MENQDACCGRFSPDHKIIEYVRKKTCSRETFEDMSATFKILGDPTRVSILHALSVNKLCVCDIAELLEMSHSAVSHQLRILRARRMVKYEKIGRKALYRLDDQHVETIIKTTLAHLSGDGCS